MMNNNRNFKQRKIHFPHGCARDADTIRLGGFVGYHGSHPTCEAVLRIETKGRHSK